MMYKTTCGSHYNFIFSRPETLTINDRIPDLYIQTLGRAFSEVEFESDFIARNYNLHILHNASGTVSIDGKTHEVRSGDLVSVFPGCHIRFEGDATQPWRYTYVVFAGLRAKEILAILGLTPQTPVLRGRWNQTYAHLLAAIEEAYSTDCYSLFFPVTAAWDLVNAISSSKQHPIPNEQPQNLATAVRFLIDQTPRADISVEEIARILRVDRSTIYRHFRAEYGMGPKQYLDRLRLEEACNLLINSRLSIKEIANAAGFAGSDHFARMFRRHYGISPNQWRQTHRK
ncbi:MAG: AraC family transcriptional regulator [Lentisphaerae bacterium]|nr:MAG: AraC family transcriptional regulator [Lentisphaerota bacterium]